MDFTEHDRPESDLPGSIADCETAADIAEIVVASFEEIELALSPVVGGRGVVALFSRSVHLARTRHAWLRGDAEPSLASLDFAALRDAVTAQDRKDAAAGGTDLLHTFRTLLATLIGASLTEKLLQPAWNRFSHDTDVKKAAQ